MWNKKVRRKGKAAIIRASPYKLELEERGLIHYVKKQEKKIVENEKKNLRGKQL